MIEHVTITHGHIFCGDGGLASGMNEGEVRVGSVEARFECLGGIDSDPLAIRDFTRFVGVPGTLLDLFSREQYRAFHGHEPPPEWREATAEDIRRAFQNRRPDIAATSSPCQGASALQQNQRATSAKYQALNALSLRGIELFLEAYADDPVPLFIFENVPRVQQRARAFLDDMVHALDMAGYAVAETVHDCGEIGGLAQHRRRYLLVARHRERVRPFVYVPPKLRVRGIGEVIGDLPYPIQSAEGPGGAMHRLPDLRWKTALRLALIPAGKDWRALESMDFGALRLVPRNHGGGPWGVTPWDAPSCTVTGEGRPQNGAFAVADVRSGTGWQGSGKYSPTPWTEPAGTVISANGTGNGAFAVADVRMQSDYQYGVYRVVRWTEPSKAVSGCSEPGSGGYTVADVRASGVRHNDVFRVVDWQGPAGCVTAGGTPSSGGQSVADGRLVAGLKMGPYGEHAGKMRVEGWEDAAHTVTGSDRVGSGALSVADVRVACKTVGGDFETAGNYGVRAWDEPAGTVSASACHDNGAFSVADPRPIDLDAKCRAVIISLDGTHHRPLTTLELAVLQGYDAADLMVTPLSGTSHTDWRTHVGNRVPKGAGRAIGEVFGETLIRERIREGWRLDAREVWVRRLLAAVAVPT